MVRQRPQCQSYAASVRTSGLDGSTNPQTRHVGRAAPNVLGNARTRLGGGRIDKILHHAVALTTIVPFDGRLCGVASTRQCRRFDYAVLGILKLDAATGPEVSTCACGLVTCRARGCLARPSQRFLRRCRFEGSLVVQVLRVLLGAGHPILKLHWTRRLVGERGEVRERGLFWIRLPCGAHILRRSLRARPDRLPTRRPR
mmetsp:Transcript_31595/g.87158  ORF Transcript_31595/g.87158 Transcript_31595/m.87158 type:complete len:200 (-) Transcript_31595:797-1396(-)